MRNTFSYYLALATRWMWLLAICAVICGGATYAISMLLRPMYQASAYLIVNIGASSHPNVTESLQAVPTFAQLLTLPAVLGPVARRHPGMSIQDLQARMTVKPQADTQLIELDVRADTPQLAADLANGISQSFVQYANQGSPNTVTFIPAIPPALPAGLSPLQNAGIGAAVGGLLALVVVMLAEWGRNKVKSIEQIEELLDMGIIALIPHFTSRHRRSKLQPARSEQYAMICAGLEVAQAGQRLCKLVMFSSALAGEGKSTIVSSVAMHLAQAGKRVILIDLNAYHPTLAQCFRLPEHVGLTDLLVKQSQRSPEQRLPVENYSQTTFSSGLRVLTMGTRPMDASELFRGLVATQFFAYLAQAPFDYVLFDTPPLLAVAEAQLLASSTDALVLVVDGSRTPRHALAKTRQLLRRVGMEGVLGVVVNHSPWRDYAETHAHIQTQPSQQRELQRTIEDVTMELPTASVKLIPSPAPKIAPPESRLPNTGENALLGSEASKYTIRPMISLSGLPISSNGLTKRALKVDMSTPVPPALQDQS